ncbi:MAG TPA: aminopeptidase, partial [Syntrophomonadaceae bacterium]|nr:aminopeptidase [Syntrophomonadaceae bacterium]
MAEVKDKLKNNSWVQVEKPETDKIFSFSEGYIDFLNQARTEREAAAYINKLAAQHGFKALQEMQSLQPGDRVLITEREKIAALVVIGRQPLEEGLNIVASHIDAPRLDLKARPLYEADGMALFKTHYYGGIKKYHWVSIPLALHGTIAKKDGSVVTIIIGEEEGDPVFTISDLLPHLAREQMSKKMSEGITGEHLNILVGSRPLPEAEKDVFKEPVLQLLKDKYGIEEDDFTSAEIELVPAFPAREVGFDRSMVGAYGQDDRVCAYASLMAALEVEKPERTAMCLFVDKEEIGSTGNTGLQSMLMENLVAELMERMGGADYLKVRRALARSYALSADVNAAVDPNYPEVFEKMNCSFMSNGLVVTKFTGSRGKSDSNDANPEFIARIRKIFDEDNVVWQVGE